MEKKRCKTKSKTKIKKRIIEDENIRKNDGWIQLIRVKKSFILKA